MVVLFMGWRFVSKTEIMGNDAEVSNGGKKKEIDTVTSVDCIP